MRCERTRCWGLLVVLALSLGGCATMNKAEEKVLEAAPAPDSGFLAEGEKLAPDKSRAPFDRIWVSPDVVWSKYTKLYVAPVDTSHLLEMSLWDKANIRERKLKKDVADLSAEFRNDLETAFRDDPKHRLQVVEDPNLVDAQTVVLEMALVQLVPNKAGLGVLGIAAWAAPLAVGVSAGTVIAFVDQGSISMEGRVRRGDDGEVFAAFADRETGKMRVLDLRSTTWWGNAHEIFKDWSGQLVELSNTPRDVQVKHAALFTFLPW